MFTIFFEFFVLYLLGLQLIWQIPLRNIVNTESIRIIEISFKFFDNRRLFMLFFVDNLTLDIRIVNYSEVDLHQVRIIQLRVATWFLNDSIIALVIQS